MVSARPVVKLNKILIMTNYVVNLDKWSKILANAAYGRTFGLLNYLRHSIDFSLLYS